MRYVVVDDHPRRGQLDFYADHPAPFYSVTWRAPLGDVKRFASEHGYSTHLTLCYLMTRAMQGVEDFRYAFIGGDVVLFDRLSVATTIPTPDGQFAFAELGWDDDIDAFMNRADELVASMELDGALEDSRRPDMVLFTSVPGIRFTAFTHVPSPSPRDARARVAFGRFVDSDDGPSVPIGIQVHHAFVGGQALGALAAAVERGFAAPDGSGQERAR